MTYQVKDLLKSEIIFGREKSNINFEENIKTMSQITFKGSPINTVGSLPKVGTVAQEFTLVGADLSEKHLADSTGKKVLLNIFPSIDTGVCAASAREFNKEASSLENTVVINVSRDLPFALSRFCAA